MGCFVGLQVPADLRNRMVTFCGERGYSVTEPHIKVVSPLLLQNTPVVRQKLESFCLSQAEFRVELGEPVIKANQILYFPVNDRGVMDMRERLLEHFKVQPTMSNFRPHLTIMRQSMSRSLDLPRYLAEAKETFSTPYRFQVSGACLFTTTAGTNAYQLSLRIAFSGR